MKHKQVADMAQAVREGMAQVDHPARQGRFILPPRRGQVDRGAAAFDIAGYVVRLDHAVHRVQGGPRVRTGEAVRAAKRWVSQRLHGHGSVVAETLQSNYPGLRLIG